MKLYEGLAKKEVLFKVSVLAKNKSEAIKKIRAGDVEDHLVEVLPMHKWFALGGAGYEAVKEVKVSDAQKILKEYGRTSRKNR